MTKRGMLFFIIFFILVFSIEVDSRVNNEIEELFGKNEEAEVIVVLHEDYKYKDDFEMKKLMIAKQQDSVLRDLNLDYDLKLTNTYTTVNGFAGKLKKSGYEKLKNNPRVKSVFKPKRISISLSDSNKIVNATRAWSLIYDGTNITGKGESVCVIDTGADYTHSALGNCSTNEFVNGTCKKVIAGYDFVNDDIDSFDDHGHGSHVAGIVASTDETYRGIAPDANIIAIKVLNAVGLGTSADLISGIEWCVNNASFFNISVITMSLGTDTLFASFCDSDDALLTSSIANAISRNISVIAATGNKDSTTSISNPACIENVTAVGGTTKDDIIDFNRNSITDLLAPGFSITSAKKGGGFQTLSGTSMSAPHVAGAFALLHQYKKLEQNLVLMPEEIQDALNDTGRQIEDTSGSGLVFPRINIYAALLSLDKDAPNITFVAPTPVNNSIILIPYFIINLTSNELLSSAILEYNLTNQTINSTDLPLNWMMNKTSGFGVFKYRIYGTDSSGNVRITPFFQISINNIGPNITSFYPQELNISISEPNNILFNITANDINSDQIAIAWYQNGTLKSIANNFIFSGNLTSSGFYNITVEISDSSLSNSLTWSLTVNNTNIAPNITIVSISDSDYLNRTNGTLQAYWNFSDADNDAITANETLWYINNTLASNYINKTSIHPINTTKLENWTFSVKVFDGANWSEFKNSSTLRILNAVPLLNINTTAIKLSETQQVNISLGVSDLDNDFLNYSINNSRFFKQNNNFIWNTNLNDSGFYQINITVNDISDIDSILVNLTINDATDLDDDGNPDFNDTDKDNDGVNDNNDYLIGNTSVINSIIQNLSISIGDSANLSEIFNGSFIINFTQNNFTFISFNFNFSRGVDNISATLLEKQSLILVVNGKDYLVTANFIASNRAQLLVNSENTGAINVGDSTALSDGAIIGVSSITYEDFAGGIHRVDFYISSSISSTLDLSKLTINMTSNGSSAVSIRGLRLFNSTKTVFLKKINSTTKSVCIKDTDAVFDSISSGCDFANETLVICNNSSIGTYSCFDDGIKYRITGLSHSAVKEFCRDNDGDGYGLGCALGSDCDDSDDLKTTDCSVPQTGSSSGSGGSGGGGGGGLAFICNQDWKCNEWSNCVDGLQTRECSFIKVAQHAQQAQCPTADDKLLTSKDCEVLKSLSLASENCNDNIQNQNEEGIDCGGVCLPCERANITANITANRILHNETAREIEQPTGFSVKNITGGKIGDQTAISIAVALILAFAGFAFYKRNRTQQKSLNNSITKSLKKRFLHVKKKN